MRIEKGSRTPKQKYKLVESLLQKEEIIQSIPYYDLQNIAPSTLGKKLTSKGKLLLTVNNKPIALMISLSGEDVQAVVLWYSAYTRKWQYVPFVAGRTEKEGTKCL